MLELVPHLLRRRCLEVMPCRERGVPSVPSVELKTDTINVQSVGVARSYGEVVCNVAWLM